MCIRDRYIYITEACSDFISVYISVNLDDNKKKRMIGEYGMRKLIELQRAYNGDSIYIELLDINEYLDNWSHMMLMNIVNIN